MRFGGHETFPIREGWLNKGLRLLVEDPIKMTDEYYADWLGVGRNMGKAIKDADPNHLVSSGTWAPWAYNGEGNLKEIHDSHYIDVGTLQEGDHDIVKSWHYDATNSAMKQIGKVTMVSEIEIKGSDSGCDYTKEGRMNRVKEKYDFYLNNGTSVVMVSTLSRTATHCRTFTPDDPLMDMIKAYPANN